MKTIIALIFLTIPLFAIPAKRTPTLITQPDGNTFYSIGFGDEYYNFSETLDGYVITAGSDKYWYYAVLGTDGKFISSGIKVVMRNNVSIFPKNVSIQKHIRESKEIVSSKIETLRYELSQPIDETPITKRVQRLKKTNTTTLNQLVLCVNFSDLANTYTSQSFQDMINLDSWKSNTGGMNTYFKEVSYNNLNVQADYQDWITASQPSSYYAYNNASYTTHMKELVKQCIDAAEANGVNFANYDNDGDGVVDGVFIVHAGKGAEEGSDYNYIWSHQGSIASTYPTLTYDGKTFNKYITLPETYSSAHVDIGVFCHEFGHMIGLPDTYDTDDATNGSSEGLGNWCLMAGGAWGGNGSTPDRPVHMSAFCKELLGYTSPTVIGSNQSITITNTESNSTSYKIWMDVNQSDECILVENRQKTGFDTNLPGSGLLIYHIDKNLSDIYPASNSINVTNTHLGIKLYEADGLEQLATDVNRGDGGDPYPGTSNKTSLTSSTTPNSNLWNNSSSGVEINNISASSSSMTADVVVPTYTGYNQKFYRKLGTSAYSSGTYHYGMVKCTPSYTGKLLGIRVYSPANKYSNLSADVFTSFSGGVLSSQTGNTISGTSSSVVNFVQLDFSPSINVTQNTPIYIRILFQTSTSYYIPVDITATATGNSYVSSDGTNFLLLGSYDIPVRVVFQSDTPLPVELSSFNAYCSNGSVLLNWQTATEINNYGFEIQRKNETGDWQKINFIQGHGNSNSPKNYSFTDNNTVSGKVMYRLKQIDFDGKYEYSNVIQLQVDLPGKYILEQNHPNPFNPSTIIKYEIPANGNVSLIVYDILGREVSVLVNQHQNAGRYEIEYNASGLSSGVYFYNLKSNNYSQTKRMLLVK